MKRPGPDRAPLAHAPWIVLLVALGIAAWWQALGTGFAQDDFRWLLRAAEGGPISPLAPRALSAGLYFRAMFALFGPSPVAFHAVQLALHLMTGLLMFQVLASRVPPVRAATAAALFLTSPALFDTLHWASAITDVLCGALLGVAMWLLVQGRAASASRGWGALVAFALALSAKEVAVGAAPVLAWLHWRGADRTARLRAGATLALALAVVAREAMSGRTVSGEPYAVSLVAPQLNLPAFVSAAVLAGTAASHASDLTWARQPWVQAAGWLLLAAWLTWIVTRRGPGTWTALAWFLGLLAPVLALERQFYVYYLYVALPGLLASVALAGGPTPWRWPTGSRWIAAALVALQLVAIQARLNAQLPTAPLPASFVLRRALIARNAAQDIERQRDALRARVVLLGQQPVDVAVGGQVVADTSVFVRDPWWDENVRGALSEGEALRVLFPEVREVAFKRWLHPEDTSSAIGGYRFDGHLRLASYEAFLGVPRRVAAAEVPERLNRAGHFIQQRLFREAYEELSAANALEPRNPEVLLALGSVLAQLEDSTTALAVLERAAEVAPADPLVRFNLGLLLWRMGRRSEARETWAPLLAQTPESDLAALARGLIEGTNR
jgi:hypothetical protein